MSLLTLPDELVLHIAEFIPKLSDLNAVARTCSRLCGPLNECLYSKDAKSNDSLALIWAAKKDLEYTARQSIARGANIESRQYVRVGSRSLVSAMNITNNFYRELLSPLQTAVLHCSASVSKLLLDYSTETHEPYPRFMKSCTLLHVASGKGLVGLVKMLIDRGADVNALDKLRRTPLHYAVRWESTDWYEKGRTVLWLLEKGADPGVEDAGKKSPRALATQSPNPFVRMMFRPGSEIAQYESLFADADILEIRELKRQEREINAQEEKKRQQQRMVVEANRSCERAERARRIAKQKRDVAEKKEAARKAQESLDAVRSRIAQQEMMAKREGVVASLVAAEEKEAEAALAEQRRQERQEKARNNWSMLRQEAESQQRRPVQSPELSPTSCSHLWWKNKSRESCQVCRRKLRQSSFRCAHCEIKVCQGCRK